MAATEGMETFAARLASFDVIHPQPRRRASNTKTSKALKWPHKSPSPAQLAKAGFCYKPTVSDPDNVMCFHCQISLDGWEEDDDPATEHLKHSQHCGWAINVCIEQRVEDPDRVEENPLSEEMMNARRSTFAGSWPHEHKKGWTCKTEKASMVEAGWYYCPTPESDDFVTCPYCNLGLDGWEPKDNPFDEHQRRSPSCLFFAMTAAQTAKPPRARKVRASKASRVSKASSTATKRTSDQMETEMEAPPPKKRMTRGTSTIRKASTASIASLRSRVPADSPEEEVPKSSPPPEDLPALTKSPSPQSSDAENKPPRLGSGPFLDGFSPLRNPPPPSSPLAVRTPSRHNVVAGGLRSAAPWSAVDLETVFDAGLPVGGKGFSGELTTPEKAMTVEEWIFHNAAAGEERLRGECERVVGIFEAQGLRALRALGGVECV